MLFDYKELQDFFDTKLPKVEELVNLLNKHSFETGLGDNEGLLDIDILPNRSSDCLCYYGIAKEIGALLQTPLKKDYPKTLKLPSMNNKVNVTITDKRCDRYMAETFTNIDNKIETPESIKKRLATHNINIINPIVDITNFVMLELGVPLHAFDLDKLNGLNPKIEVRGARAGEKIEVLSGEEYKLENELLITNGDTPLAIAGIKGGGYAEITEKTKNILLEVAHFEPTNIRSTSQKIKLRTDSSIRFSNNPSIHMLPYSISLAHNLILEICGGEGVGASDIYEKPVGRFNTGVSIPHINKISGLDLSRKEVENIFDRLGFDYEYINPREKILQVIDMNIGKPYALGSSVLRDAPRSFDCSSFCCYCYALCGIPIPRMSFNQYAYSQKISQKEAKIGDIIFFANKSSGASKMHTKTTPELNFPYYISDVEGVEINHCGIYLGGDEFVHAKGGEVGVIKEKISEQTEYKTVGFGQYEEMNTDRFVLQSPIARTDLNLPETIIEEITRIVGYDEIPKKEIKNQKARVNKKFYYTNEILRIAEDCGFYEIITPSFSKKGEIEVLNPHAKDRPLLRNNLSDYVSDALEKNLNNAELFGQTEIKLIEMGTIFKKTGEEIHLCTGIGGTDKNSRKKIATHLEEFLDKLKKDLNIEIKGELVNGILEVNITHIFDNLADVDGYKEYNISKKRYKPFSKYPFIVRDISILTPSGTESGEIEEVIRKSTGQLLFRFDLFDRYEKGNEVSYAYRLVFQADDRTLTDNEVSREMSKLESNISRQKDWIIR